MSPERTLGHIGAKLARGPVALPYRAPAIGDLVKRIERALEGRC